MAGVDGVGWGGWEGIEGALLWRRGLLVREHSIGSGAVKRLVRT